MVGNYMELSTAHIKESTAEYLAEAVRQDQESRTEAGNLGFAAGCGETYGDLIVYPKDEYGYFIPLTGEERLDEEPEDLAILVREAEERGCSWLILDRDAEENPELPVCAWEGGTE